MPQLHTRDQTWQWVTELVLNAQDEKGKGCYDICKLQALSEKDKRPLEMLKWMGTLQMSDLTGTTTGNRALPLSAACDEEWVRSL